MKSSTQHELIFVQPLPKRLIGCNALVAPVCGWLTGELSALERIQVSVDGGDCSDLRWPERLPARLWSGLALDSGNTRRTGFAGEVQIPAAPAGFVHSVVFTVTSTTHDRSITIVSTLERQSSDLPEPSRRGQAPRIAICMAVYNPERSAFERQVRSITAQSVNDWICIVNDDGSDVERQRMIREVIGTDDRFWYFRNNHNLGFYGNFEATLGRVPEKVDYIALADQDDDWYPDKLASLQVGLGDGALLCYSDMRIVADGGQVVAPSYWGYRKNSWQDLSLMLVANTVTGAACMFRRELLDRALPFPPRIGDAFHDHWLACAALAAGRIEYIDRPLHDYHQHSASIIGHCGFEQKPRAGSESRCNLLRLLRPANIRSLLARIIGSGQAVYWHECRRIESICQNLLARGVDDAECRSVLSSYGRGWYSAWSLLKLNLTHADSARLTNNAERRLAHGYLIHSVLTRVTRSGRPHSSNPLQ